MILVVDYFSRYPEIFIPLHKHLASNYGVPEILTEMIMDHNMSGNDRIFSGPRK